MITIKRHKSPISYVGGKYFGMREILPYFPHDLTEMVSPFMGGCSLELSCAKSGIEVYANDIFEPLYNFFLIFKDKKLRPDFMRRVRHIKRKGVSKDAYEKMRREYYHSTDKIEQAVWYYTMNVCAYGGMVFNANFSKGAAKRFNDTRLDKLEDYDIPDNIYFSNADYKDMLDAYRNKFAYLDPPYPIPRNIYGNDGDTHRGFDHEGLADYLKGRDDWIMSNTDSEYVRDLYSDYEIVKLDWYYAVKQSAKSNEVLIINTKRKSIKYYNDNMELL